MRAKLRTMIALAATEPRLHRGVLTRRALAPVLVADGDPRLAGLVVVAGDLGVRLGRRRRAWSLPSPTSPVKALTAPRNRLPEMFSRWPRYFSQGPAMEMWSVVHLPLALTRIGRSMKSWPSHAANGSSSCSRSEVGETCTSHRAAILGWRHEGVLARGEAQLRELDTDGFGELDLLAAVVGERVGERIEVERAREGERHDGLRRGHEGEGVGRAVVALGEVAVVAGDDGVQVVVGRLGSCPLADARTARVGQHGGAGGLERRRAGRRARWWHGPARSPG